MAIRYGTTHAIVLDSMRRGQMDEQAYQERLLKDAWITMSPKTIGREIDMGMGLIGCQDEYFKFKTLTPLYPTMTGKMTDASFYEDLAWDKDQFRTEYN